LERELVAVVGDAVRFRALYEREHPAVLAYFLRRLGREDAVDAAADVFVVAWRRIETVPAGSEARLWLFGVAHNVLRNRRRSLRRALRLAGRLSSEPGTVQGPPESVISADEDLRRLGRALERLRPVDREVVRLRLWEELPFGDVGSIVGCSRHAAEQRYARAIARLQSAWPASGHEGVEDRREAVHERGSASEA
jgi:RNA polymerase sigma-70 factor (ECF subfamily)